MIGYCVTIQSESGVGGESHLMKPKMIGLVTVFSILALLLLLLGCHSPAISDVSSKAAASKPGVSDSRLVPPRASLDRAGFLIGTPSSEIDNNKLTFWYADAGDNVLLTFRSTESVILNVDVNQNGIPDSSDLSYAVLDDGTPCVQSLRDASASAACGQFLTSSIVRVRRAGADIYTSWKIPKREIAPNGRDPSISLQAFSPSEQKSSFYPASPFLKVLKLGPGQNVLSTSKVPDAATGRGPANEVTREKLKQPDRSIGPDNQHEPKKQIESPLVRQPLPAAISSSEPVFRLTVSADGSRLIEGCTYSKDDPRFSSGGNIIVTTTYERAMPNQTEISISWYRDGVPVSYFPPFRPTERVGHWSRQYDNRELDQGAYQVVLSVDTFVVDRFKFSIGPTASPCAQQ